MNVLSVPFFIFATFATDFLSALNIWLNYVKQLDNESLSTLEIKPCGQFEMWRHFDTKQKSKSFTLCNCVWLCVIVWFTLTLNFRYLKLKMASFFFWGWRLIFFDPICYHASLLQQIHFSKLLCGMYGLTAKSSVATLNICQILMR